MNLEFCKRLRAGETLYGTIATLSTTASMHVISRTGFDWIFIDAEHAPLELGDLERMIATAGDVPCLVRLPCQDDIWIKRALDLGASGIIVPQVNSAEQAAAVVRSARFSPVGARGIGLCRANKYGYGISDYLNEANDGIAVVVQAEHADAVANVEDIAAVEGVDCVFVGPNDLSASLGLIGQLDHPVVNDAIHKVRDVCKRRGKTLGYFSADVEAAKRRMDEGFSLIACGADVVQLAQAETALLAALKES